MPRIHPTAIVSGEASLAPDVEVGAYALIGDGVTVGAGTIVGPFTRIEGPTAVGHRRCGCRRSPLLLQQPLLVQTFGPGELASPQGCLCPVRGLAPTRIGTYVLF